MRVRLCFKEHCGGLNPECRTIILRLANIFFSVVLQVFVVLQIPSITFQKQQVFPLNATCASTDELAMSCDTPSDCLNTMFGFTNYTYTCWTQYGNDIIPPCYPIILYTSISAAYGAKILLAFDKLVSCSEQISPYPTAFHLIQ